MVNLPLLLTYICHMTRDVKVSIQDWSRDEEFLFGVVVSIKRFSLSVSIWLCVTSLAVWLHVNA